MWCLCTDDGVTCFRRESTIRTMAEATTEAEKHAWRCEALAVLLTETKERLERARATEAERARAAAEAAQRLQMEEEAAALALRVQADTLRLQQVQAQLGVAPPPRAAEESQCVVCMDATKQYAMLPCLHMCACEACAQHMLSEKQKSNLKRWPPRCPVCRGAIERIGQVFT